MNKEKLEKFAKNFFRDEFKRSNDDEDKPRTYDIKEPDDVMAFYRELNENQMELGHEFYIEDWNTLQGFDGSIMATIFVSGIGSDGYGKTIIANGDVDVNFESIKELVEYVMDIEQEAQYLIRSLAIRE